MRWLVILIGLCIALTVLRAAIAALLVVLVVSILWGAFFRPAETFGFILLLLFGAVLQTHTLAMLILIGFLAFILSPRGSSAAQSSVNDKPIPLLPDRSGPTSGNGH